MRIAYVTPYQGPTLVKRRPIIRNRTMSGKVKIELIAESLHTSGHEVEVISEGEVIELDLKFYPAFSEPETFHPEIPIHYASSLPIRRLNGLWSTMRTLHLFKARHRVSPFDVVIIYNLRAPLVACANHAMRRLGLPVILEYEDDVFVDLSGEAVNGFVARRHHRSYRQILNTVAGGIAVSPYLLSQFPPKIPKLLLRGVVGNDMLEASKRTTITKGNWVLFSGNHFKSNGVAELVEGWKAAAIPEWELHITGYGSMTDELRQMAKNIPGIVFHGLVDRQELVRLMSSAKVCINPHEVSKTPGNVFAFKIIEYLSAGAHVVTTPMGAVEKELESGITYLPDNTPATIAATLQGVVQSRSWTRTATEYVHSTYGPGAVAASLDSLLQHVVSG